MGNSTASTLKAAIINNQAEEVRSFLEKNPNDPIINELITRKGDTGLMLAALLGRTKIVDLFLAAGADLNHMNRDGNTALDLAVQSSLPPNSDMLYRYRLIADGYTPEADSSSDSSEGSPRRNLTQIPEIVRLLLDGGARGRTLERLVLFAMRDSSLVRYIIHAVGDLMAPENFRLSGLLLQVVVWFDQMENLQFLLDRGVKVENFWLAPFMPRIEPSNQPSLPAGFYNEVCELNEYFVETNSQTSDPIQELKFGFVHEWFADWDEGANPRAQYRAALQVSPEAALYFVRSANSPLILHQVMGDVIHYLPATCSGPDLTTTCLFNCLTMAGYRFDVDQQQRLRLKFNVDMEPHINFNKQPKKLRHICRISIRFMFSTNVHLALMRLPELPSQVRDFLVLESDIHL